MKKFVINNTLKKVTSSLKLLKIVISDTRFHKKDAVQVGMEMHIKKLKKQFY